MASVNILDPRIKTVFVTATDIQWDTDDDSIEAITEEDIPDLPSRVENISFEARYLQDLFETYKQEFGCADMQDIIEELVVEYLSDNYGYCIYSVGDTVVSKVTRWHQNSISV